PVLDLEKKLCIAIDIECKLDGLSGGTNLLNRGSGLSPGSPYHRSCDQSPEVFMVRIGQVSAPNIIYVRQKTSIRIREGNDSSFAYLSYGQHRIPGFSFQQRLSNYTRRSDANVTPGKKVQINTSRDVVLGRLLPR